MKLAASTINAYLYGIRDWCIGQGLPDPLKTTYGRPHLRLEKVLKGIKKLHKETVRPRLSITIDLLIMLISFLSFGCFGQHDDLMLSAVCTLVFYGFLRFVEFTVTSTLAFRPSQHLCMNDVIFCPEFAHSTNMTICFKYSKTDLVGKGHVVTLHAAKTLTCAVKAIRRYLQAQIYESQRPLFLFTDGTVLTRSRFISCLRSLLEKVGLKAELNSDICRSA